MRITKFFAFLRLLCLATLLASMLPAQAQNTCQSRPFNTYEQSVSAAYIAYYGRPADTGGLAYWAGQLASQGGDLGAIIDAFGNSAEYRQRFGSLSNRELIRNLYQQLYGRDPDQGGWLFYEMWLDTGVQSLASIAVSIMDGTEGSDVAILNNRKTVAQHFITRMDALGSDAPTITDGNLLANLIAATSGDVTTADAACRQINELIDNKSPGAGDDLSPVVANMVLHPSKPYYAIGEAISWQIEAAYKNQRIDWSIDGAAVNTTTWSAAASGTYRLKGDVKNAQGAIIAYARADIVVAKLKPLLAVNSGAASAYGLAISSGTELDGLTVQVPGQAVTTGTQISAFAVDTDPIPFTGLQSVSPVIEMQPVGTQFAQSVQIRIPFDLSSLSVGENLWVTRYSGGEVDHISPSYLDYENNEVVFETDHFSFFKLEKNKINIFSKTDSEEFIAWTKNFMNEFCAYDELYENHCWNKKISNEDLSRALNTVLDDGTTPYELLKIYHAAEKAAKARSKTGLEEGAAIREFINDPSLEVDSLINGATNVFKKLAKRFGFYSSTVFPLKTLENGYKVYTTAVHTFQNICLKNSANVLDGWRKSYPSSTLRDMVKDNIMRKSPGYWPEEISCASFPGRVDSNIISLDNVVNYLSPIMLYLEMVDLYNQTNKDGIENIKQTLLFSTKNYSLKTRMHFKYTPASSGRPEDTYLDENEDKDGAFVKLLPGAKFITIVPEASLVPLTNVGLSVESVRVLSTDGINVLSEGTFSAKYIVKPGLSILKVETVAVLRERMDSSSDKEYRLKSVKNYKIYVPRAKATYTATSAELGTASLSRDNSKIKLQVKPTFKPAAGSQLRSARQVPSGAALSQSQEPYVKAAYATNIQCGTYKLQAGQDGMLQVDISLLNSGILSNCTAYISGTQGEQDEDEVLASTFGMDLNSALSVATASTIPNDRAVVGILSVNGQQVTKPRQERDINAGDTVEFIYYVPPGADILAADQDGAGQFGAFQGAPVKGYPGFYTTRTRYADSTQGIRRPSIKARINGVENTASAPELYVKLASSLLPAVSISPQSQQVAVGATVTLNATVNGAYSTIVWQKLQGPANPTAARGTKTTQVQLQLPVAGTYVLAAKVCNGGDLCTSKSATVQVGTVPDNPQPDDAPIDIFDNQPAKIFTEGNGWSYSKFSDFRYGGGGPADYVTAREATHKSLTNERLLTVSNGVSVGARVSHINGDQNYGYGVFLSCWDSASAVKPKTTYRVMITKSGLYRADTEWGMGQVIKDWDRSDSLQGTNDAVNITYVNDRIIFLAGNFEAAGGSLSSFAQVPERCSHVSAGVYSSTNVAAGFKWFNLRHLQFANSSEFLPSDLSISAPIITASAPAKVPPVNSSTTLAAILANITGTSDAVPDAPLHVAQLDSSTNHVYFLSRATNLLPGAYGGVQHLYGFDPASRELWRLSQAPSGEAANADTTAFSLAGEAGKLVFRTRASNLEGGPGLHLLDINTGARKPLLTALQNGASDPGADNPVLSATAGALAFDAPDAYGHQQMFTASLDNTGLYDQQKETPLDADTATACCAALSADGRYLAWQETGHNGRTWARVLNLATDVSATLNWPQAAVPEQKLRLALSADGAQLRWLAASEAAQDAVPLYDAANPLFVSKERLH